MQDEVGAQVRALLDRSNRLGAAEGVTNFAGGNTSSKIASSDPITGEPLSLLYIKGSGGDLGTLTEAGLAVLVQERLLALREVYAGADREDEMVPLLDHCRFGLGGAPPSIDTALHALLPAAHVDHTHPPAVIGLACARDGERLTGECYGPDVAWTPWRRPGFELALRLRALWAEGLRGVVLGGHGLISWGDTSQECLTNTLGLVERARAFVAERLPPERAPRQPEPVQAGPVQAGPVRAAETGPVLRGLLSSDDRVVGSFTRDADVLAFLERDDARELAEQGTSCPDHFLRTRPRPLWLDPGAGADDQVAAYRDAYRGYYLEHRSSESPPMRGADPSVVLVPGEGMWTFGPSASIARIAGEYFRDAIQVMRGAQALSAYDPIDDAERFGVEYWDLEVEKLTRQPPPRPLQGRIALVTGAGSGIGKAIAQRLHAEGAAVVLADLNTEAAAAAAEPLTDAIAIQMDVGDEASVDDAFARATLAFGGVDVVVNNAGLSISAPLLDTTAEDWDRLHRVLARGSFLVSRAAARLLVRQGLEADIVYVVSKNATVAGPDNVAYASAKADQAHQVRLLAAELGSHGIRVNGVSPDAVVKGSGIFASGWGRKRAEVYGVDEADLGAYYAKRTLLGKEILPEHVAAAVFAIVSGDLGVTTGTIIPVDGGVPAAFPR
jgi:rhamnulose-1-phosphate aldolase/alcohol dehydrogenase